jgi:hypothetical protein
MSTQTGNVRYVSLFAAARLHRTRAGGEVAGRVGWRSFLRRLEALIAVASVHHHRPHGEPPLGIVGRNRAGELADQTTVVLDLRLAQPAYNMYRGSLSALRVMDIFRPADQLYESAIPLAEAWDINGAGPLALYVREGTLPETLPRDVIVQAAPAFCLCRAPEGSEEQRRLARWLLALDQPRALPSYESNAVADDVAWRSVSWRLALELVRCLPGPALGAERLMARLLAPDIAGVSLPPAVAPCLALWQWVAARTFFERGWTLAFDRALRLLRGTPAGLPPGGFRASMKETYQDLVRDEPLQDVADEAYVRWEDQAWLLDRFGVATPRDHVSLLCAAVYAADSGRRRGPNLLAEVWRRWAIPFEQEFQRLEQSLDAGVMAGTYWATIAETSLVEHLQSSFRTRACWISTRVAGLSRAKHADSPSHTRRVGGADWIRRTPGHGKWACSTMTRRAGT